MARQLTIKRKQQFSASNQTFNVYVDNHPVAINMSDRRPLYVKISDGPHVVTFEHIIKKRNPEPTLIPAGTENITVLLKVQGQKMFTAGTWVTTVLTGE